MQAHVTAAIPQMIAGRRLLGSKLFYEHFKNNFSFFWKIERNKKKIKKYTSWYIKIYSVYKSEKKK